jgi:hypothetical protein
MRYCFLLFLGDDVPDVARLRRERSHLRISRGLRPFTVRRLLRRRITGGKLMYFGEGLKWVTRKANVFVD